METKPISQECIREKIEALKRLKEFNESRKHTYKAMIKRMYGVEIKNDS